MSEPRITLPVFARGEHLEVLPLMMTSSDFQVNPKTDTAPKPTRGSYEEDRISPERWAYWGEDDMQPLVLRKKLRSSPMAGQTIFRMVQMMFGNGVCYYSNKEHIKTKKMNRVINPKVERFLRLNRIATHFLPAMFTDWRQYFNAFCEIIFSQDNQMITNIYQKNALFCRLETQNQKNYKTEHLYFSPQFAEDHPDITQIKRIPLFDWQEQEEFLKKLSGRKFAWHCKWPGQDPYYAEPFHIGLAQKDGWLDVNAKIPQIINAMMDNQITLKYLIHVPESYYKIRDPGFMDLTKKEKREVINQHIEEINAELQGVDKTFSSIFSLFKDDNIGVSGNQGTGKIEVEAVDDKLKRDSWVPSADHSDSQIVKGLGLHPSQMGLASEGGKMGAGSGSDQRESYNTGIQLNTSEQGILLEPLNWIATYNAQTDPDWDITFFIDHTMHTTTNNVETGLVTGQNAAGHNKIKEQ